MSATETLPTFYRSGQVPEGVAVVSTGHRGVSRRADAPVGQWDDLVESVLSHEGAIVGLTTAAIYHGISRSMGVRHDLLLPRNRVYGNAPDDVNLHAIVPPDAAVETVVLSGVPVRMTKPAHTVVMMLMKSPLGQKRAAVDEEEALDALYGYLNLSGFERHDLLKAADDLGANAMVRCVLKGALGATNPS